MKSPESSPGSSHILEKKEDKIGKMQRFTVFHHVVEKLSDHDIRIEDLISFSINL